MGIAPGGGEAAHVHEVVGALIPKELEELLEGPRRVPDGQDETAGIFRIGATRPLRYDVAPVLANL